MAQESRGLGRGLGALLGAAPTVSASRGGGTLPLALMQSGALQPRREIHREPLEELAASIKAKGVIQPIIVRPLPAGASGTARYEIVAGERRWQAAKLAGLADIPVIVRDLSDKEAVAVALIENIQREELTAAEEARSLKRLTTEFSLTQQEVADSVGRSRAAVSNLLRLMELADEVKELLEQRRIEMGHARALLGLSSRRQQIEVAGLVAKKSLSVRETEALVRRIINPPSANPQESPAGDPDILRLERELADKLGAKVAFQHTATGKGKLVVSYNSLDELEGILGHIQ